MKRMSIAEQTLKGQIDQLNDKREGLIRARDSLSNRITELFSVIQVMEVEQSRLRGRRETQSVLQANITNQRAK